MNKAVVTQPELPTTSEAAAVARIVGGAVVGALGGLVAGGVVYASLVVAIFGALGGAVAGTIAAARTVETR